MGERKVLNKYYPPDFDPALIPRAKRAKNDQTKVRMMLPMSIQCNTCGEYLHRGKKFNSRKETVTGEEYLGIRIFRFYIKCVRCSAELTIKTDPKHSDYACEWGASRNFESWRENTKVVEEAKQQREKEEANDAMKALENKTLDNKVEMDILDALDEIRSINARHSKVDPLDLLLLKQQEDIEEQKRLTEEDEELVRSIYGEGNGPIIIKRIIEEDDPSTHFSTPVDDALKKLSIEDIEKGKKLTEELTYSNVFAFVKKPAPKAKTPTKVGVKVVAKPKSTPPSANKSSSSSSTNNNNNESSSANNNKNGLSSLIGY